MTGLNIGCGTDIRPGYINLDRVALPGVDVVWDITKFPYPFENDYFTTILLINVLEHIPDTIKVMEELYRLCKPGATLTIRVPYWNSTQQHTDITHVRSFSEFSMDYFDPERPLGKRRTYYSTARFAVKAVSVWVCFPHRCYLIRNRLLCKLLLKIAHYLSNIASLIEFDLIALKPQT
jgi:SAM-dependent methyltransferase